MPREPKRTALGRRHLHDRLVDLRGRVHAGAIPITGGKVSLKRAAGCPSYSGTSQHGVASAAWPSYDGSLFFPGHGTGKCDSGDHLACPARFEDFPDATSASEHSCECAAGASGSGWGDGTYTRDSALCAAAVHAGAVPATGGKIAIKPAPGCPTYRGTSKNGVTTSSYGSYGVSFYFPAKGNGTCR